VCETNPNDRCCESCGSAPIDGCLAPNADPSCAPLNLDPESDPLNLRCWDQKRRFGVDLLYPISRYVDGLTQTTIARSNGESVRNPLFPKGGRTPSQVVLSAIVGVPWQDLATKEGLEPDAPLEYLSHEELTKQDRWSLVLGSAGDPATGTPPTPPRDKWMFETNVDRSTLFGPEPHPLLGALAALAPSSSMGLPNAINGRESLLDGAELQPACIFQLREPRECTELGPWCPCQPSEPERQDAVCEGTTQTHAKAGPGVRELSVLKAFGDITGNAVPASICPKLVNAPDYVGGYAPVISALMNRLQSVLPR
jgi:hypothetical protein